MPILTILGRVINSEVPFVALMVSVSTWTIAGGKSLRM